MRTNRDLNDARNRADHDDGCGRVWDLLSVYADSETTSDEAAMVETHLAVCSDCTRDLAFMRATTILLNTVPEVAPPVALRSAILAATSHRQPWWQRAGAGLRTIVGATPIRYGALAAGAAALAFVMLRAGQDGNIAPVPVLPGSRTPQTLAQLTPPASALPADTSKGDLSDGLDSTDIENTVTPERAAMPPVKRAAIETRVETPAPGVPVRRSHTSRPTEQYAVASGGGQKFSAASVVERANNANNRPVIMAARLEEGMPEPPADMLGMAGTGMADMNGMGMTGGSDMTTGGKIRADIAAPPSAHIQLAADIQPIPSGQMVSLADLKRSLRRQNSEQMARSEKSALEIGMSKQIRLDVYRGRF